MKKCKCILEKYIVAQFNLTPLNDVTAVYFEQGNFENAIKECERAIEVGRENRADFKIIAK